MDNDGKRALSSAKQLTRQLNELLPDGQGNVVLPRSFCENLLDFLTKYSEAEEEVIPKKLRFSKPLSKRARYDACEAIEIHWGISQDDEAGEAYIYLCLDQALNFPIFKFRLTIPILFSSKLFKQEEEV